MFEPFFTTKPVGKGTGLGLSQIFGFARESGGDVVIDSTVGVGTTVSLYLPRSHRGGRGAAAEPLGAAGPTRPRRPTTGTAILVVEDDPAGQPLDRRRARGARLPADRLRQAAARRSTYWSASRAGSSSSSPTS